MVKCKKEHLLQLIRYMIFGKLQSKYAVKFITTQSNILWLDVLIILSLETKLDSSFQIFGSRFKMNINDPLPQSLLRWAILLVCDEISSQRTKQFIYLLYSYLNYAYYFPYFSYHYHEKPTSCGLLVK